MTKCSYGKIFYIPYASSDDIPKEEFRYLHKQYWNYIADWNCQKKPLIRSSINGDILCIASFCFACEYAGRYMSENGISDVPRCIACPLKKYRSSTDYSLCISPKTPYGYFRKTEDPSTIQDLARQIANLELENL